MFNGGKTMNGNVVPYNWKITAWKGIQIFVFGGVGAIISYLLGLPPTETILVTVAVLKMLQNVIKNTGA